ncbi:MAG: iron-sulfur cluster-binding domain-containing protein [Rhodanobacteraceae bacterium]|nr:iron-sulfur cluster-binding domain-containing protein [Rhodanobacteraceae bacterium]
MDLALQTPRKRKLSQLLRSPWLRPLNDPDAWEQILGALNPMWSTRDFPARVLAIVEQTADSRTFVLQPGRRWPGHRAGQHVVVEVEIDGRRLHRSFSLSAAPRADRTLEITVKRQPGARVSGWLHDSLRVGDMLRLSAPGGGFLTPDGDDPVLLLSAGSGITPVMAMLEEMHRRGNRSAAWCSCMPVARRRISSLRAPAAARPRLAELQLQVHHSAQAGRFDAGALARWLPHYRDFQARTCGPRALVAEVEQLYRDAGVPQRIRSESYLGRVLPPSAANDLAHRVHCSKTEQVFTASARSSLLGEAEAAGLRPAHGCRIGICKTCQCSKRSGTVENLRTGEISSEPDELIQLCISVARSPLELVL